jgi:hypothetical protein
VSLASHLLISQPEGSALVESLLEIQTDICLPIRA